MDFNDLKPIKLSLINDSKIYHTNQKRPELHHWQLDWHKLSKLIHDNYASIAEVRAGIAEDWLRTNGIIWDDQIGYYHYPNSHYDNINSIFWGYSSWGTPTILVTFLNESEKAYKLYTTGMDYGFHYLGGN
ncbi:hypothetical protein WR164_09450 [Philodulcilactobacillus myokoensis]|uniref:Uncharacterized protein n=1 Tax=Philodulcilactobacillus myokoensis TaxID=2929573 RepID=A0A9W6B1T1_9LACO|nr:hypothetical protein [Philodulcilactobacillus myokoensis]GLB46966.1 hypothetical protein WR164_09450 [Philodulcilactobacillus myokoensis]